MYTSSSPKPPPNFASPPTDQETSQLFKLAPELRNRIYELVFYPIEGLSKRNPSRAAGFEKPCLELAIATPPSKALLLTCKTVYYEARKVYIDAYRRFWKHNLFQISVASHAHSDHGEAALAVLQQRSDLDVHNMRRFVLVHVHSDPDPRPCVEIDIEFERGEELGLWKVATPKPWVGGPRGTVRRQVTGRCRGAANRAREEFEQERVETEVAKRRLVLLLGAEVRALRERGERMAKT